MTNMPWKKIWQGIKVVITFVLAVYLIQLIDWQLFGETLHRAQKGYFIAYILAQALAIFLSVKKWQVVAAERGLYFDFVSGTKQYLLGMFLNNFFPSVIGGDVYRGHWLGKNSGSLGRALYTVLFERLQGLWLLLLGASFFPLFYFREVAHTAIFFFAWIFVFGLAIFTTGGILFFRFLSTSRTVKFLGEKVTKYVELLRSDKEEYRWSKGLGVTALFIFFGPFLSNWFLFSAFGAELSLGMFFFLLLLAAVLSNLPLSLGNFGVKEGVYAVLFSAVGIPATIAVAVALTSRVVQMGFSLLALPEYLLFSIKKEED